MTYFCLMLIMFIVFVRKGSHSMRILKTSTLSVALSGASFGR